MIVKELMEKLNLTLIAGASGISNEVKGVYAGDLLSWVMAHANHGEAWVTIQTHPNVIAVATLLELSCVIVPENAQIEDETIKKADEESIPVLVSPESCYSICYSIHDIMKGN